MTGPPQDVRRWVAVAVVGCALLWLSILIGGVINDGYSQTRDFVSALSGRGSTAAFVGMTGLIGFSSAHFAAAMAARRVSRTASAALFGASAAGLVVALARINCPNGAARCSINDGLPSDTLDTAHGLAVGAYEFFFVVGTLALALALLRRSRSASLRVTAVALFGLALTSLATLQAMPAVDPGGVQRLWLALNTTAVLLICISSTAVARTSATGTVS